MNFLVTSGSHGLSKTEVVLEVSCGHPKRRSQRRGRGKSPNQCRQLKTQLQLPWARVQTLRLPQSPG